MQGMVIMTQLKVPDNLEVFGEAPAPRHRQGWRRWLASVRMRWMILHAFGTVLGVLTVAWAMLEKPLGAFSLMAIIPGMALWLGCLGWFVGHFLAWRGEGMTPELKRWCLYRLRLNGEDPDPLFLTLDDLQRAIRVDEARVRAMEEAAILEQDTAEASGARRQVRL